MTNCSHGDGVLFSTRIHSRHPPHHRGDVRRSGSGGIRFCPWYLHRRASAGLERDRVSRYVLCYPAQVYLLTPVSTVHAKGSFIYLQLWALGRAAPASGTAPYPVVSASNIPLAAGGGTRSEDTPRPLSQAEIKEYVGWYAEAARKFVVEAGGDGVEVHAANGYLIDQFTQTNSNVRTDAYGGDKVGRCKFGLEVVAAVTKAVGAEKVGVRMSPWSEFQGELHMFLPSHHRLMMVLVP